MSCRLCQKRFDIIHSTEERQKESSVGSGRVEGGSLAGKKSAGSCRAFSRLRERCLYPCGDPRVLFGSFGVTECEVIGISNLHPQLVFCSVSVGRICLAKMT